MQSSLSVPPASPVRLQAVTGAFSVFLEYFPPPLILSTNGGSCAWLDMLPQRPGPLPPVEIVSSTSLGGGAPVTRERGESAFGVRAGGQFHLRPEGL